MMSIPVHHRRRANTRYSQATDLQMAGIWKFRATQADWATFPGIFYRIIHRFHGKGVMPSWKEIDRIAKDPGAVRILAKSLLRMTEMEWRVWELDFLDNMSNQKEPLTTRQAEKLLEIRDSSQIFSTYDGFNVVTLMHKCWVARFDLSSDDDIDFIERLKDCGSKSIRRRQVSRLFRCCRELFILEPVT
jgi:hypothetical protein